MKARRNVIMFVIFLAGLMITTFKVSKEPLFPDGIEKVVSDDVFDISIPSAKIIGSAENRRISYTVIIDNKSEEIMRNLRVYLKPSGQTVSYLSKGEEVLICECDLDPFCKAIEDTTLRFSIEGTASFLLQSEESLRKNCLENMTIENLDNRITLRMNWDNGVADYECPVTVKCVPYVMKRGQIEKAD